METKMNQVEHHEESFMDDVKADPVATPSYSKEEEGRAVRKLDWFLIPLLGVLYMLSYVDRGNVGNAYTAGMGKAWHITSNEYSWLVTIYYIAYICFQWLILAWRVVRLPVWLALMVFGFATMSILQAAADSFKGLMALRFFLGIFEAGFGPGVALYLSFFYHRREMGLRYGLWISFSALASCFASSLAYAIVNAKASIATWKLLFIVEGVPSLVAVFAAYLLLPNGPSECPFLNERENLIIGTRACKGRGGDTEKKINFKQVFAAFYDYKNYLQAVIIFCLNTAFGSLPAYLPTIIKEIGYSSIRAQGFSAPPYLSAFILCVTASFVSDRCRNRGFFITGFACAGAAGYLTLAFSHVAGVRYFATYLVCAGVFPAVALTFTWVTDNQGSASKRGAGLAIFGMIGQVGPILGARLYPKEEGPTYEKGMAVCAGLLLLAACTAQVLSVSMRWQNRRRDREYGVSSAEDVPDDVADLGDAHPGYRYIL